jgi:hypothetical protein
MSTGRNRQKHLSIGTTLFWITAWAVTFTLPYLFQAKDGAGLGPMIGFVRHVQWLKTWLILDLCFRWILVRCFRLLCHSRDLRQDLGGDQVRSLL